MSGKLSDLKEERGEAIQGARSRRRRRRRGAGGNYEEGWMKERMNLE